MLRHLLFLLLIVGLAGCQPQEKQIAKVDYVLVIHGGAGTILKKNMTPEREKQYIDKLSEVLKVGEEVLKNGGTSLDAVTKAIVIMENSPLFNAGKGAVFTAEGENEMDASIMDGSNLKAGAVGGISNVKNPILVARAVMENTVHVMLAGEGALEFAKAEGLEIVDSGYFFTERRWNSYLKAKEKASQNTDEKSGTVGAVALDKHGNLAAATSTGGMTYKMKGRIGDTPIIGAGNYADNNTCAVSGTGHGEYFMRNLVAYEVSALMKYKNLSLKAAADKVIHGYLNDQGGTGGLIAVSKLGEIATTFNTAGMYRGYLTSEGKMEVLIYKE